MADIHARHIARRRIAELKFALWRAQRRLEFVCFQVCRADPVEDVFWECREGMREIDAVLERGTA